MRAGTVGLEAGGGTGAGNHVAVVWRGVARS